MSRNDIFVSINFVNCPLIQCSFWSRSIYGGAFFSSLVDTTASADWHVIIQCSRNSPLKYFCSNPKNGGNWDRATFPPSSLAGGRRATEQNLRCSLGIFQFQTWAPHRSAAPPLHHQHPATKNLELPKRIRTSNFGFWPAPKFLYAGSMSMRRYSKFYIFTFCHFLAVFGQNKVGHSKSS